MPSRRRLLVTTAAGLAVLLLAAAVAVPMRADAAWQQMLAEVNSLRAEVAALPRQRNVLWGEPGPGNAFTHYDVALTIARQLQSEHRDELIAIIRDTDAQVAERRGPMRERWQPLLAALRAGAAATDVTAPLPGDGGRVPQVSNLLDARWAANAAVFEARALRHEGRGRAAVQHTLDAASLGMDFVRRGTWIDQMIGVAIMAIATGEAWPEPALATLDREALDLLASGLARLDDSLPSAVDDRIERLFTAWHLQHAAPDAEWMPSRSSTWRFGFSTRWMLADAFLQQTAVSRRLAASRDAPWPDRTAHWDRECAAALACGNPLLAFLPNIGAADATWRQQRANLRLLRLSADLHRGVEAPALVDPIGGAPIVRTETKDGIRLTCEQLPGQKAPTRLVVR